MALSWSRNLAVCFLGLVQLGQEFFGVAVIVGDDVRVFEIEIVVARLHFIDGDFPGDFVFFAFAPTSRCKALDTRSGSAWSSSRPFARRRPVLVKPDFLRRLAFDEEEQVRADQA